MSAYLEIINQYLEFCKYPKGLNPKTIKAYRIDLTQFYNFICSYNKEMDKSGITSYITHISKQYKPKSIKRKIASLKAFFSYLEYEEIIDQTPFHKIKTHYKDPFILPRTIPISFATAIFKTAYIQMTDAENGDFSLNRYLSLLRNVAVLELLFATGIRVSELCSLKDKDVNLTEKYIKVYGKGAKERVIQIGNENVIAILKKYVLYRNEAWHDNDSFFLNRSGNKLSEQSVRLMIDKYSKAADVPLHITPHMFRHTFATLLLEENVDIRYIQQVLGHSSIITTQIYTHVTSNMQRNILTENNPRNHIDLSK